MVLAVAPRVSALDVSRRGGVAASLSCPWSSNQLGVCVVARLASPSAPVGGEDGEMGLPVKTRPSLMADDGSALGRRYLDEGITDAASVSSLGLL